MDSLRRTLTERLVTTVLQAYWRRSRGLLLSVHACVRDTEGRALLVRANPDAPWQLPGGPVKRGEAALSAIQRILAEQCPGQAVISTRIFAIYSDTAQRPTEQHALYVAEAKPSPGGASGPAANRARFFPLNALPEAILPSSQRRIEEVAHGRTPAADW